MYRIIDGRGTGKTSRLLLLAKEQNGVIVCGDPDAMKYKAEKGYGIVGIDYYSYNAFLNGNLRGLKKPIFIDEIDLLLKRIDNNIQGYTLTNED